MSDAPSLRESDGPGLSDLLARVENAANPDQDLNADLWWWLDPRNSGACYHNGALRSPRPLDHSKPMPAGLGRAGVTVMAPNYTGSLDAVMALKDKLLPGHAAAIGDMAFEGTHHCPWACIWTTGGEPRWRFDGATPALALCGALLKALQEQPSESARKDGASPQTTDVSTDQRRG